MNESEHAWIACLTFRDVQVVDVNRSNKGTRSGGIGRFSTMVVVGNFQVFTKRCKQAVP